MQILYILLNGALPQHKEAPRIHATPTLGDTSKTSNNTDHATSAKPLGNTSKTSNNTIYATSGKPTC